VEMCENHGRQHRKGVPPKKDTCIHTLNRIKTVLPRLCGCIFRCVKALRIQFD
jgi:hypothetical protein